MLEQLAKHTDEESIILSACVTDGGFSHMASETARDFLSDKEELKSQFLRHCLKERMRNAVVQNQGHQLTSTLEQKSKSDQQFHLKRPIKANEVSRRKRLKTVPPSKNQLPQLGIGSNYSTFTSNTEINNIQNPVTDEINYINDNTEISNINPAMKLKTVPIKVEIDIDKEVIDVDSRESTMKDEMFNASEDSMKTYEQLKHLDGSSLDLSRSGHAENDSVVVDLSISTANSPFSGSNELQSMYGTQNLNQVFPVKDESQDVFTNSMTQLYNSTYPVKVPKKRVYRKVECDICHKMIYITNIKVHKFRHFQHMDIKKSKFHDEVNYPHA